MKFKFRLFGYHFGFMAVVRPAKELIYGYTNVTEDGKYIVLLDYDNIDFYFMCSELKEIQRKFDLSTFFIFKTNKGYHAICLDKVNYPTLLNIMKDSSVDRNYLLAPQRFDKKRMWVLRFSEKRGKNIEFEASLYRRSDKIQSNAHMLLLRKIAQMDFPRLGKFDKYTNLTFAKYYY